MKTTAAVVHKSPLFHIWLAQLPCRKFVMVKESQSMGYNELLTKHHTVTEGSKCKPQDHV